MVVPELIEIIQAERLAAAKGEALARIYREGRRGRRSTFARGLSRWLERDSRTVLER